MARLETLKEHGYCILPNLFGSSEVQEMRRNVLANTSLMGKTRSCDGSFHLAGFHRYPYLTHLHSRIASNSAINDEISDFYETTAYYTIGLSDITINRSQHWHTDLLRGKYASFLTDVNPWRELTDTCIKALVYLQPGRSLRIIPGSHKHQSPLSDQEITGLPVLESSIQLELDMGDVVLMDIRAVHRGSTDEEINSLKRNEHPKILISTVFGKINSAFAMAMQTGNLERNKDWDRAWLR